MSGGPGIWTVHSQVLSTRAAPDWVLERGKLKIEVGFPRVCRNHKDRLIVHVIANDAAHALKIAQRRFRKLASDYPPSFEGWDTA